MAALFVGGVLLSFQGAAEAATPTSPVGGNEASSTPLFSWLLESGEEAQELQISTNPAPGEGGGFTRDEDLRYEFLADFQTAFAVGNTEPLFAGTWYWHVQTIDQNYDFKWSPTASFTVPDFPPVLKSFRVHDFDCIDKIGIDFEYSDNSRDQRVAWRLELLRHRHGGRIGRATGSTDETDETVSFRTPPKAKRGKKYWAQLTLTDPIGQVAKSQARPLRLGTC